MSDGGGARVLVVDDDADLIAVYQTVLESAGYRVSTALSGEVAIAMARNQRPDLVITDISMPKMDGFELIERLKAELGEGTPPIIVCSGFELTEQEALARGASIFFQKPATVPALLEAIAVLLRGERPDRAAALSERVRAKQERLRQRRSSEVRWRALNEVDVARRAEPWIEWLRRYFDCGSAGLFLLQRGGVLPLVVCGSHMSERPGSQLLHATLAAGVETGTSLIVADMAAHPSFRHALGERPDIAFFAGVPLATSDGTRVGALCIADSRRRPFEAESLMLMEELGRRGVSVLFENGVGPAPGIAPVLQQQPFDNLLAAELQIAGRCREAVEVSIMAPVPGVSPARCAEEIWRAGARARLGLGFLMGAQRLGLFVRAAGDEAARHMALCLRAAQSQGLLNAAGVAAVAAGCGLSRNSVIEVAEAALAAAESADVRSRVERFVVGKEAPAPPVIQEPS